MIFGSGASSLEDFEGLVLEFSCNFASVRVSLSWVVLNCFKSVFLFLTALKQVHLDSVVAKPTIRAS